MERLQAHLTVGAWCVGGLAGLLAHYAGGQDLNPLLSAMLGLLLVVLAGVCGGGLGFFLHYGLQQLRKRVDATGEGPEYVGAVALGSATGAFLGLVAAMSLGVWKHAPLLVAGGAGVLSVVFSLTGRLAGTMLRMLVLDSRRARRESGHPPGAADKDQDKRG